MAESKNYQNLFGMGRTYTKNGNEQISGAVEMRLKKPYGSETVATVRDVQVTRNGQIETRTVCNVEGSIRVSEITAKQLKYFFNIDILVDSYLNIRVAVWGMKGQTLAKFHLAEGDIFEFFASNIKLESFNKKDGSIGYQLSVTATDFKNRNFKKSEGGSPASAAPAAAAPAGANYTTVNSNDFEAVDDSDEDLPF